MAICPTCGRTEPGKPRSPEHHRRFFGLCKAAWEHWPSGHVEQFANPEELRKWLTLKSGHYTTTRIDLAGADPAQAVILAEAAMRAAGTYARARVIGHELVVFRPDSIAFQKLDQHAFTKLNAEVETVLELEAGLKASELLNETEGQ